MSSLVMVLASGAAVVPAAELVGVVITLVAVVVTTAADLFGLAVSKVVKIASEIGGGAEAVAMLMVVAPVEVVDIAVEALVVVFKDAIVIAGAIATLESLVTVGVTVFIATVAVTVVAVVGADVAVVVVVVTGGAQGIADEEECMSLLCRAKWSADTNTSLQTEQV